CATATTYCYGCRLDSW
nr:immunoglobulin heavy chain junction region [Macaca mulatta]